MYHTIGLAFNSQGCNGMGCNHSNSMGWLYAMFSKICHRMNAMNFL